MFEEYENVLADDDLRQGDVFRWIGEAEDPWKRYGVVVTADCDLKHNKHDGVTTYIPLLRAEDYLSLFYLPGLLDKQLEKVIEQVVSRVRRLQKAYAPEYDLELSREAVIGWLRHDSADGIRERLGAPQGAISKELNELIAEWRTATAALATHDYDALLEALVSIRGLAEPPERVRDKVADMLREKLCSLPGDGFFIGAIGPGLGSGYVAYARRPREIADRQVALRTPDLRDAAATAERVSRLKTTYRFRLTQQMSQVFSDIGLPTDYEKRRTEISSKIADELRSHG